MRTPQVITAAVLAAALLTLGACSDDSSESSSGESGSSSPSASASPSTSASASASPSDKPTPKPAGTTIRITIKDDTVQPNGSRVKVKRGEPVTLQIDADTPGELHVHSTPEQELEFDEGQSTKELTIDQPGIVDVEDHELEQVIVQLEVS